MVKNFKLQLSLSSLLILGCMNLSYAEDVAMPTEHRNDVMGIESHTGKDESTGSKIRGDVTVVPAKQPASGTAMPTEHKNDVMGVESHTGKDESTGSKIQGGTTTVPAAKPTTVGHGQSGDDRWQK